MLRSALFLNCQSLRQNPLEALVELSTGNIFRATSNSFFIQKRGIIKGKTMGPLPAYGCQFYPASSDIMITVDFQVTNTWELAGLRGMQPPK